MKRRHVMFATALLASIDATTAVAGDADAARGLVAEHCTSCHVVPGYEARFERADIGAPSFQVIADTQAVYTDAWLTTFLQHPHYPMAGFILSASDIDNIIAFIAGLRDE